MMIRLQPMLQIDAVLGDPQATPGGPIGERRLIPVLGGQFRGERLRGELLSGGSDCQVVRADGVTELDIRVALACEDGTVVYMRGFGLRHGPAEVMQQMAAGAEVDPSRYYFREALAFEAPAGCYDWLNRVLAIGSGRRTPNSAIIDVFEVC